MPELPDVEKFKKYLEDTCLDQSIRATTIKDKRILEGTSPQGLGRALKNNAFRRIRRHGKFLFLKTSQSVWLVLHFGMDGHPEYGDADAPLHDHARAIFEFETGKRLAIVDRRLLGRVAYADSMINYVEDLKMGPDALHASLNLAKFTEQLQSRTAVIKSTLMNQSVIAGIGNVCADEILFQARLHPKKKTNQLGDEQIGNLFERMREVLHTLVDCKVHERRLPPEYLEPSREPEGRCPLCDASLSTCRVNGRKGYFCSTCQKK